MKNTEETTKQLWRTIKTLAPIVHMEQTVFVCFSMFLLCPEPRVGDPLGRGRQREHCRTIQND